MAELMLGVLAEDANDCEVIKVLVRRIFEARGLRVISVAAFDDAPGERHVYGRTFGNVAASLILGNIVDEIMRVGGAAGAGDDVFATSYGRK